MAKKNYPKRSVIFLVFLLLIFIGYITYFSPLPFNQEIWNSKKDGSLDTYKIRHRMADGLLMMDSLIGMKKSDVIKLLGTPPNTSYFHTWDLVYRLGIERGLFSIDNEWLVLKVDDTDSIIEASLVSD